MAFFESMLILVLIAIGLLQVSRRFAVPYPTMLAMAGVAVAALPWAPEIAIDPQLSLALFIAPALLDAAFDTNPRELKRHWRALVALVAVAVLLTAGAVMAVGVWWAGLPPAAALALGAIVAPPDAAAAAAMLSRLPLPRRAVAVLKGESLLNDAVALLLFGAALSASGGGGPSGVAGLGPALALAVPGGIAAGWVLGRVYLMLSANLEGTLGGLLFQFAGTFAVWVIAERLRLSPILAVVVYAMTLAQVAPYRAPARSRVHSYSVWETAVFLLNVLAFLLMGLQARTIVARLPPAELGDALVFAGLVLATVVVVRLAWVMAYNGLDRLADRRRRQPAAPSVGQALVVSWCGMRGLVTLATALALPPNFPGRDLIQLSALAVVLGTLVLQGLTLAPLIRAMRLGPDRSFGREIAAARLLLLEAGLASLDGRAGDVAERLRADYRAADAATRGGRHPHEDGDAPLRLHAVNAQRDRLAALRQHGEIDDDVFHALEQELDWAELAASPPERWELVQS